MTCTIKFQAIKYLFPVALNHLNNLMLQVSSSPSTSLMIIGIKVTRMYRNYFNLQTIAVYKLISVGIDIKDNFVAQTANK